MTKARKIPPRRNDATRVSAQRNTLLCQHIRKSIAAQVIVFALPQRGERVETFELGVDDPWMAHDHAVRRQAIEEARNERVQACRAAKSAGLTWREIAAELDMKSPQEAERLAREVAP